MYSSIYSWNIKNNSEILLFVLFPLKLYLLQIELKWLFIVVVVEQHEQTDNLYCCCSIAKLCPTPCNPMDYKTPGFPVLHYLPEFAQTHVHWIGDAVQPLHPLLLPSPFAFSLSHIRVFSLELALLVRCCIGASATNECWCPSNEYSGLISFQIDWCNLFAVQGTLKSLLPHQSSKASIIQYTAFFVVKGSLLSIYCISYIWQSEIYISSTSLK